MSFTERLKTQLADRHQTSLYRTRNTLTSAQSSNIQLDGSSQSIINFCSNDYLGLAQHPRIIEAFQKASAKFGVGSGASHLVVGHHREHHLLEEELAEFLGVERTLVVGSGFSANVGVLNTLLKKDDSVFLDKLNHASLIDGALNSVAKFQRYLHNDMSHLASKLARNSSQNKLIVSDAVFSMDGDSADITSLHHAAIEHNAWLMLDDAHGFGVLGDEGRGSVNAQNITQNHINIYMATFGKALGTSGAFIAGSELLIESLIQFCRNYIYSTAMPPALASATRMALSVMKAEEWRRDQLKQRIAQFKSGFETLLHHYSTEHMSSFLPSLLPSDTAIQPIILGDSDRALSWSSQLAEKGILISAIRSPTVPKGTARLRVTLSTAHTKEHVDTLLNALQDILIKNLKAPID